ncbi:MULTISPECIES: ankyrin repeat domain-containing protein [unclassified Xanthomonas]|uniref:ankyrin repeat domain-containing protein n=1 Tax=unclassified Xanthomonas TaxID=2643310 RepID=UPI002B23C41C|nr:MULTISPECIES: ankyrin repeat domain-containing protein [unclassified Xanthomonas]MEA9563495.1 ankyrin repeat domain-containing protein [Xanthomonas sp. WHRI 8932A]MEA9634361.1 ankyrin repeat domain-containing protein [Xanthomonas sp. WHRI 8812E]
MKTLPQLLRGIENVADFAEIEVGDANTRGLFNNYPLHVAAVWGDCEAIQLLVSAGARINQRGEHGFTPLMEAVAQDHQEAAALLISLGAEPLRNDHGQLPSEYAQVGGNNQLAAYLVKHGL